MRNTSLAHRNLTAQRRGKRNVDFALENCPSYPVGVSGIQAGTASGPRNTVSNNHAGMGAGVSGGSNSDLTISGNTISGNTASGRGGGVFISGDNGSQSSSSTERRGSVART